MRSPSGVSRERDETDRRVRETHQVDQGVLLPTQDAVPVGVEVSHHAADGAFLPGARGDPASSTWIRRRISRRRRVRAGVRASVCSSSPGATAKAFTGRSPAVARAAARESGPTRREPRLSSEHLVDRPAPAGRRCGSGRPRPDLALLPRVDPQGRADRRHEVGHRDRSLLDRRPVGRGPPVRLPPLDPAAREHRAPRAREVVAAPPRVDLGVRPNSPIQETISVVSSSPRVRRSSIKVDHAGSSTPQRRLTASRFCAWLSQLATGFPSVRESVTSTNGTPRSTSRRASRQPWPKSLRP